MSRWIFREGPKGEPPAEWSGELSISPLFLKLLWRRGFTDKNDINAYLSANLGNLTPPVHWPRMPQAAEIITSELLSGKRLAVWGDYDVDGITGTAIVLDVLEQHGYKPLHYLPDRLREGYGLNIKGIEKLAAQGCQTLLTVDCGISNNEAIARARELGIKVIVSDHHLPPEKLPPAEIIVNPRISAAGKWPCANLAGNGVAFYLMAAVNTRLAAHTGKRYLMDKALDLVALGTLADVMYLEGENRILVRAGLKKMEKPARPGMAALKIVSGFDQAERLNSNQAVFRLAPRINAAGRMGNPDLALSLLRAGDLPTAMRLAQKLDDCNTQRKSEEKRVYEEALAQAGELLSKRDYSGLVLYGEDWHQGIIGIVASRVVEKFNRPAIVLCRSGEYLKGSGRSVEDFDLYAGLAAASHHLCGFGGHRMAAGLSLPPQNLAAFREEFSEIARDAIGSSPREPVLTLEDELNFSQTCNERFARELDLMQPFGSGNSEPVFASRPLVVKRVMPLGYSGEHVRLQVREIATDTPMELKAWRMAAQMPKSLEGKNIRIAYTPRIETYRGMPAVNVGLKDFKLI